MKEARKSSRPVAAPTILCTVASNSHLSYAAAMMQSARTAAPDLRRIIFLCDEPSPGHSDIDLPADIVPIVDALGTTFNDMVIRYTRFLTCAASKPYIFRFLFSQPQVEKIIYLNSDILVFSPPKEVERALARTADLVLTPHMTAPLSDGLRPNDLDILKAGVWNTGFLAMRRSPAVDAFLDWWAAMCETLSLIDIPGNLFAEQRWVDMAPAFVRRTKRLLHPGYNAAYWNLGQREVARAANGRWRVNSRQGAEILPLFRHRPERSEHHL